MNRSRLKTNNSKNGESSQSRSGSGLGAGRGSANRSGLGVNRSGLGAGRGSGASRGLGRRTGLGTGRGLPSRIGLGGHDSDRAKKAHPLSSKSLSSKPHPSQQSSKPASFQFNSRLPSSNSRSPQHSTRSQYSETRTRSDSNSRHSSIGAPPDRKGTFKAIAQHLFRPLKYFSNQPPTTDRLIMEEIYGSEVVPGQVYDYDLGWETFRELLQQYRSKMKQTQPSVLDNYYYYDQVLSISGQSKQQKTRSYVETVLNEDWSSENNKMTKKLRIHYQPPESLATRQLFHLTARIIRFQAENHIFDIILPRTKHQPRPVNSNLLIQLLSKQPPSFPRGTKFMHKRILKIEKI